MKNLLSYILISILYFSCGNPEVSIEQNNDTPTVSVDSEDISPEETTAEYPAWLEDIIREKTEKIQKDQDGFGHYKIKKYSQLNNFLSFSITNAFIDGVCDRDTLTTYINGKKIDQIGVEFTCDADQVDPEYKWTEYDSLSPRSFEIRAYREYVIDASLIGEDGFLIEHTMDQVETKVDSIITIVRIEDNGEIARQE